MDTDQAHDAFEDPAASRGRLTTDNVVPADLASTSESPALVDMVTVEGTGIDTFTGSTHSGGMNRLFGGLVAAQALTAATATVDPRRRVHSLHCYFMRAGRTAGGIDYTVDRIREGRSFSTRRVTASQDGTILFEMLTSFQADEAGADWSCPPEEFPATPDGDASPLGGLLSYVEGHLDLRPVDPEPRGWEIHPYWFRANPPVGTDPGVNAAVLTYVSDMAFMANAREPGSEVPMAMAASIDHAIWFHRPPRVDSWLLFSTEPVANVGTRGTVRGEFRSADGQLVATAVQEALLRPLQ